MKKALFFLIILILKTTPSVCQQKGGYETAIQKAETELKNGHYSIALTNLDDAEDLAANDNIKKEKIKALRKRIFSAMEKDRQDAILAKQDAINAKIETQKQRDAALNATQEAKRQRDTAQFQTEIAKKSALEEAKQKEIAKKAIKIAKSKELAAKALLEYSKGENKDATLALRLAYTALNMHTVEEVQDVFDRIFLNLNEPYYLSRFNGRIVCFNTDSSRFVTNLWQRYNRSFRDSTYIYDRQGKLYTTVDGIFTKLKSDSLLFLINNKDSLSYIYDWQGKLHSTINGKFISIDRDTSRFITRSKDSTYIYDWQGNEYHRFIGNHQILNQDSSKILTSKDVHTYVLDRKFTVFQNVGLRVDNNDNPYEGSVRFENLPHIFNRDSSKFLIDCLKQDSFGWHFPEIFFYNWDGKLFGKAKGNLLRLNQDNTKFVTYDGDSTRIYGWNLKLYETLKGEVDLLNQDSSKYWTYFKDETFIKNFVKSNTEFWLGDISYISPDSSRFVKKEYYNYEYYTLIYDWQGNEYKAIKGELQTINKDASKFLTYDGIYDWQGKFYGNTNGGFKTFNEDSTNFLISYEDKSFSIYNWDGKLFGTIKGTSWNICLNSKRLIIDDGIYDWRTKRIGTIKGKLRYFNQDSTKFLAYDERNKIFRIYTCEGVLIQTIKNVDDVGYTKNDESRFILRGFENYKSYIYDWQGKLYRIIEGNRLERSNNDFSKFLFYDDDKYISRIYDWQGELYGIVYGGNSFGNPFFDLDFRSYQFNKDSSKFLRCNSDSIWIYDWEGNQYGALEGTLLCFNQDSSKFMTYNRERSLSRGGIISPRIYDWVGQSYNKPDGKLIYLSADSMRFLIDNYNGNNIQIYDRQKQLLLCTIKGHFVDFKNNSSLFLSFNQDSIGVYNLNGESKVNIIGTFKEFNQDYTKFLVVDKNNTRIQIYDWDGILKGTVHGSLKDIYAKFFMTNKGVYDFQAKHISTITDEKNIIIKSIKYDEFLHFNKDSSKIFTINGIFDWLGQRYGEAKGILKFFNADSSKLMLYNDKKLCISDWQGNQNAKIEGEVKYIKRDLSKFLLVTTKIGGLSNREEIDRMLVYDWDGKLYLNIEFRDFKCFNRDSTKILTKYNIYDWDGTKTDINEFMLFNQDSSKLLTYDGIYNWEGKLLNNIKNDKHEIKTVDSPLSQFCVSFNNYTVFYDMNWAVSSVYSGDFFKLEKDGKHVIMRRPYYKGYIYETRPLYQNIHEFMKNEVAELTADQRILYGLEDYLKD